MPRHEQHYPDDTPAASEGDGSFLGVNAKLAPANLPPGWLASASNARIRDGLASTRPGAVTPGFARIIELAEVDVADAPTLIAGVGIFSDPQGLEWMLLATDTGVWRVRDGHTPRVIAIPQPFAVDASQIVEFVQCFNTVLLFRGADNSPWQWSGDINDAFTSIVQTNTGDGTVSIPNGSDRPGLRPVLLNNRLIVPHQRTQIAVSDLLDYTRYDEAFADFNVTTGNDDTLTALYPFSRSQVLCFKDQSIATVDGIGGTLEASLDVINREIGCVAGKTVAMVGGDVMFLGATGVFRLQQIIQDRLQTSPVAVSDPIEPLIRRINWRYVSRAVAVVHGDYYLLAVPIDGSTSNNAILPFNTVTNAWEGIHQFTGTKLDALLVTDHQTDRAVYAVDFTAGRVLRLYDPGALSDLIGDTEHEIVFDVLTRAYSMQDNSQKQFRRALASVLTWKPSLVISVETDGVNETTTLGTITASRTAYFTFGKAAYVASNVNDDHGARGREDYSVLLSTPFIPGTNGIVFNLHQATQKRFPISRHGRSLSVRLRNSTGSVKVQSVQVEGDENQRGTSHKS